MMSQADDTHHHNWRQKRHRCAVHSSSASYRSSRTTPSTAIRLLRCIIWTAVPCCTKLIGQHHALSQMCTCGSQPHAPGFGSLAHCRAEEGVLNNLVRMGLGVGLGHRTMHSRYATVSMSCDNFIVQMVLSNIITTKRMALLQVMED
ncbi:hypothetical protein WJX77_008659 [Trebouxia sp. C0004]